MQTHLNLYQHTLDHLAQLRQEATANALAKQVPKNSSWLVRLQHRFFSPSPLPPFSSSALPSHAQATPKTAH